MRAPQQILIADDHPLFRMALAHAVRHLFENVEVHEADDFAGVQAMVENRSDADLLLLDLRMPGVHGFSGLAWLRSHFPTLPIAIVSAQQHADTVRRAVEHGVVGYIGKSASSQDMAAALQALLEGNPWLPSFATPTPNASTDPAAPPVVDELTLQQMRVLGMLGDGLLNKQIAHELSVSEATVKAHVTAILRKLGASNRTHAVLLAMALGLIEKTSFSDHAID